ncbi:DNA (cytosine-5-)-methyltransferase [Desemzia sp. FAM 24101]|uniref:DNA (cytosine-5-)-methyltransferase n=1 Tax=unclassified Desemzia TaxID=2685243 RepID=UPI0038847274
MTFKVVETFSGIGAQAKALSNIAKQNPNFKYSIEATVEWEIGAIFAYDIIHNGKQNLEAYNHFTKQELIGRLSRYNLSSDGKQALKPSALKYMPLEQLKAICHSIDRNNNLVDISSVTAEDLPNDIDLLTYSFPCQDLSISSYWHKNFSGISKDVQNRSGLLWEIERILNEYESIGKKMPRFLLMENVTAIHGPMHEKNFELWQAELERLGYINKYFDLNASNFGIPQTRLRTFMISVFAADLSQQKQESISHYLNNSSLNKVNRTRSIDEYLRLDYSIEQYRQEAIESTPNKTPSRDRIELGSVKLAKGKSTLGNIARTITTKQDRFPNAGIIIHKRHDFGEKKATYRNLTPRETFLLMGFDESDFQNLIDNNIDASKSRKFLSSAKLLKLSGNSIVVDILEEIFFELLDINNKIINTSPKVNLLESHIG